MATGTMCEVRDQAIAQSKANANQEWFGFMLEAVRVAASIHQELTTDDVWAIAERYPGRPTTHSNSAIGPVMLEAIDLGYISRKEGFSKKSQRPQSHGRLLRVFTSNLFKN